MSRIPKFIEPQILANKAAERFNKIFDEALAVTKLTQNRTKQQNIATIVGTGSWAATRKLLTQEQYCFAKTAKYLGIM